MSPKAPVENPNFNAQIREQLNHLGPREIDGKFILFISEPAYIFDKDPHFDLDKIAEELNTEAENAGIRNPLVHIKDGRTDGKWFEVKETPSQFQGYNWINTPSEPKINLPGFRCSIRVALGEDDEKKGEEK